METFVGTNHYSRSIALNKNYHIIPLADKMYNEVDSACDRPLFSYTNNQYDLYSEDAQ
jgi:hypothetical protein